MRSNGLPGQEGEPGEIDTSVAHAARVYDHLLGGWVNFAVDRDAAERAYTAWPGGLDGVRADARAHRAVLGRIVRYLVRDAGIRQFLDIGTGIPKEDIVHEVAQREAPEARVVYVDRDPIVLAHAHQLLRGTPEGATTVTRAGRAGRSPSRCEPADRVRVEVADDGGTAVPTLCRDDVQAVGGRGLRLVNACSLAWSYYRSSAGTVTWFECAPEPLS